MLAKLLAILVLALLLTFPATGAEADEDIYVLTAGGTTQVERIGVERPVDATPHLASRPPFTLELDDGGLATYSDIVVLPGGHLMMGGGSGRGAVIFDESGHQVDQFFGPGELAAPPSVVAAGFLDPNDPYLLLMGDDSVGRALLYDAVDETYIWHYSLLYEGLRGQIARAILLPDDRVAIAATWPGHAISAVITVSLMTPAQELDELWSSPPADDPDAPVLDNLHPLRDLMADIDGRMLITSRDSLTIVDSGGEPIWQMSLGDDPGLGGQFQSARWLDDGLIVAATRQPGVWNQPHLNHRVHLIDPDAEEPVVDTSASFEAAPLRLEPTDGHGATGTRDYFADAFEFDGPSPEELVVTEGPTIDPQAPHLDENAFLTFGLRNDADESIALRRSEFRVAPKPCDELTLPDDLTRPWWSDPQSRNIPAQESVTIANRLIKPEDLGVGEWCGQLAATGRDGSQYFLDAPIDFEIQPPVGEDSPVTVGDLGSFDDVGIDDGAPGANDDAEAGCACSSTSPSPSFLVALFLLGLFFRTRPGRSARLSQNR